MEQPILSVSLKEYKKQIDDLKASLLGLEKTSDEYKKIAEEVKTRQDKLNEVISVGKKNTDAASGSYNAIQQEVRELVKANKELEGGLGANSQAFIENAKRINELNNKLKEADAQMGYFQRNVGDYKNAFLSAFSEMKSGPIGFINGLSAMGKETEALKTTFGSFKGALSSVATEISLVGKQLWALVANPVGATIAGIATALMLLMKGLNGTEENTNRLNGIMSKFKPILDQVDRSVQSFAEAFLDVAEPLVDVINKTGILKVALGAVKLAFEVAIKPIQLLGQGLQWVTSLIDPLLDKWNNFTKSVANSSLGKALGLDELQSLSDLEDDLAKRKAQYASDERQVIEENAKLEKDVADIREKAYDREHYNAKQRKEFMLQYHKLQKQELANQLRIKQEEYNIALLESKKAGNTAETNKKLSEQRAELIRIKALMSDNDTALSKELKKVNSEIANGNKVKTTSVKTSKQEKDVVMDKLKLEERLLNLRIANNKTDLALQAQLLKNKNDQEKRSTTKEISDVKARNEIIYQLNVKLTNDLKALYRDALVDIDKKHLNNLKDQLSRLKAFQADYNKVFQQIVDEEEKIYKDGLAKIFEESNLPFNDEMINQIKNIGGKLVEIYQKADEESVRTGEEASEIVKRLKGEIEGTYESLAFLIEENTSISIGNIAKMFKFFQDQREDNEKKTKEDYAKRQRLFQENILKEKALNQKGYENTLEYSQLKMELAKSEYESIENIGKFSTETNEEYEQRRLDSLQRLKEAEQNYYDTLYQYAEDNFENGKGYYDRLREEEERTHYDNMKAIAEEYTTWLKNNENASDAEKEKQQKASNKRIEAEEKRHSKAMKKIDNDQIKSQKMTTKDWLNVTATAGSSISQVLDTVAQRKEDQLQEDFENGKIKEEQAKKEFETIKDFQIAATTIDMLSSLVSVNTSVWSDPSLTSVWAKIALSATQSAAVLASGIINIDQIKNTEFGSKSTTNPDTSGGGSGNASTVDFSAVGVNPLLDPNADIANVQNVNVVSDETSGGDNRVYILQQDITDSNKQVEVRQKNTTF